MQFVWGVRYVDDLILRDRDATGGGDLGVSGSGLDERLYALTDALYNVTALVNSSGTVQERFLYEPYGKSTVLDANFSDDADGVSDYNWEHRFTGRRLDLDTGLQLNRERYLHLELGRWTSRDPIGYGDGYNLYQNVLSNPIRYSDPFGEWKVCCHFRNASEIWAETYDCMQFFNLPAQAGARACCRLRTEEWFTPDWRVLTARPGSCSPPAPRPDPCANRAWIHERDGLACMAKCLKCKDSSGAKTTRTTVAVVGGYRVRKTLIAGGSKIKTTNWLVKSCQNAEGVVSSSTIRAARFVGRVSLYAIIIEGTFSWGSIGACGIDCGITADIERDIRRNGARR